MTEKTGYIYLISFTYGKFQQYVGQTRKSVEHRINGHKRSNRMPVDRKMRAHPDEYFVTVIEDNVPVDQLDEREKYYIKELDTFSDHGGLNMTDGGNCNATKSAKTLEKLSNSLKEHYAIFGHPMEGIPLPEETKKKIGLANSGENNGMYGKHHTAETLKQMSESHKGHECSESTREKISISNTGKVRSEEVRLKISESQTGRPLTDEWKANISKGLIKYYEENGTEHLSEIARKPCKEETKVKISIGLKEYYAENGTQRIVDMRTGTHHTEEAKKKMSEAKLGKKQDPAVVAKRTEAVKASWQDPEHRELISNMFTGEGNPFYGKKHDAEAKKKMSEAKLEHWRKLKEKQLAAYLDWEWLMTQGINTQFPIELTTQAVKDGR